MSEQSSTNAANNKRNAGTICHVLPCSIDQDITAPIAQYFHPTPLPAEAMPKVVSNTNAAEEGDTTAAANDNGAVRIMAAQFRGRGLLCAVDNDAHDVSREDGTPNKPTTTLSKLPSNLIGVALSPSNSNTSTKSHQNTSSKDPPTQSLKVLETFQHMNTWSHEHDVQKVMRERHNGSDKYGLNAVLGWCELAHDVSAIVQ